LANDGVLLSARTPEDLCNAVWGPPATLEGLLDNGLSDSDLEVPNGRYMEVEEDDGPVVQLQPEEAVETGKCLQCFGCYQS